MFKRRVLTFVNLASALAFSAANIMSQSVDIRIDPRVAAGRKRSVFRMGSRNRYTGEDLRAIRAGTHEKHGQAREMARRVNQRPAKSLDPYRVMRENLVRMGLQLSECDFGKRMITIANAGAADILKLYRGMFLTADGRPRFDTYIPKLYRKLYPDLAARLDAERARLAAA